MKTAQKFGLILFIGVLASLIAIAILLSTQEHVHWVIVPICGIVVIAFVAAGVGLWEIMMHYVDTEELLEVAIE